MVDGHEGHEHSESKELSKMTEREVWLEFVDTCSICGLAHCTAQNKCRARLWIVVVIAAFICFGGHFYLMLSNYLEYPLNPETEVHTSGFQFPDVTLCIKHPFDTKRMSREELGVKNASFFWQYFLKKYYKEGATHLSNQQLAAIADKIAMKSFRKYAENPNDTYIDIVSRISRCQYKGKKCKLHYVSEAKLPNKLNCITFHPYDRSITRLGPDEALHLTIDTGEGFEITDSINELYQSNGYEITIHENGTEPNFKKLLFMAQSGQEHDISMTMSIYKKWPTPNKPCLGEIITDQWAVNLEAPPQDIMSYRRTRDTCKMLEYQRTAIEECGCWRDDFLIPLSEKFGKDKPLCHELPEYAFFNDKVDASTGTVTYEGREYDVSVNSKIFQDIQKRYACFNRLKETGEYNKLEHCYHNCESTSYDANMAVSNFNFNIERYLKHYDSLFKKLKLKQTNETVTDLKKLREELNNGTKMLTIKIYPVDLDVMYTEESLAYPLTAFFSDFGGNIGLWIGCTVITLAEVLELFIRLGYLKIKRLRQGKQQNGGKTDGEKGKEDPEEINLTATT